MYGAGMNIDQPVENIQFGQHVDSNLNQSSNSNESQKSAKRGIDKTSSYWTKFVKQSKAVGKILIGSEFLNNIKSIMFLSMILSMITPVLGSLTATYANETIILDYAIFVFIHLIYYDFDLINQKPEFTVRSTEHQSTGSQV